jgi:hypothetical protein
VELKVKVGSPLAEVFVIDRAFELVQRAIGDLVCNVEPGVYKVKAKLGDAIAEELVVLDDDQEVDLTTALDVGSAAPVEGTARSGLRDMVVAEEESRRLEASHGAGARIFVMTRRWAGGAPPAVSLHDLDGDLLAEPDASVAGPDEVTLSVSVEVSPGAYFLRWRDDSGVTAEQCVHAVDGWQTQVFVLEEGEKAAEIGRTRVSVLMSRESFDSTDEENRLVEEARTALADERRIASDQLNGVLFEKFNNPMLGLFGAHLMLVARDAERVAEVEGSRRRARPLAPVQFDQQQFDRVVAGLEGALGHQHPDVVALATQTSGVALQELTRVYAPPMLFRSWKLLVDASNREPELVPASTWRQTVHLLPLRPFFLWTPVEDIPATADELRNAVRRALRPAPPAGAPAALRPADEPIEDETLSRVSREFLAPRAAIEMLAAEDVHP